MNLRRLFCRQTVTNLSKINGEVSSHSSYFRCVAAATTSKPAIYHPEGVHHASTFLKGPKIPKFHQPFHRCMHTSLQDSLDDSSNDLESESESDATMNEFLSRFVWIMRKKISEAYPKCDKNTVDGMLVIIVKAVVSEMEKGGLQQLTGDSVSTPTDDFSEDLWRTVWEVSNIVLHDMEKEKKKEKIKTFLQSEEVKEMYRFAGEVGIRGDMLRELRFKWAREKMEDSEFYENLERLKKETESQEKEQIKEQTVGGEEEVSDNYNNDMVECKQKIGALPKRHGKIKYKIYGLDLSKPKWVEVADKIHESSEVLFPQEPKPISGKCKLVTDKILSLQKEDDPAPLLREWIDVFQPNRVDWDALLDRLKHQNFHLYLKIAEVVLDEETFQANIRDYSKLIDALAKENRLEDAERILKKMNDSGIEPDVITLTSLVHMYCKSGNLDRAKESFESLRSRGFQPATNTYYSLIMAYVNAGRPKPGESLMHSLDAKEIKHPKEIYMALLRSFAKGRDVPGVDRMSSSMEIAGFHPSLESCTVMVEAYRRADNPEQARITFDQMIKYGYRPDDNCTASMIAAYEKNNFLDKALSLLLELEKDGFEPGVATYTVLVDWFSKLELFEEAEQILDKIAQQGEAPPFKLHISLCDMYIKAGDEKKALQALGVLESKIEQLEYDEFERIIGSLIAGGYGQDARRIHGLMQAQGFVLSERLKVDLMAFQAVGKSSRSVLPSKRQLIR